MRALLIVVAALILAAISPAAAQDRAMSAARQVIIDQQQAFKANDSTTAFGYAAPAIREIFSNPETFMRMVRTAYAPVYRNQSLQFLKAEGDGDRIAQTVSIVDMGGELWDALYTLERQADGAWKITSCVLLRSQARSS